jgi:peptidyl-prolyl cis-trans isomerase SurA
MAVAACSASNGARESAPAVALAPETAPAAAAATSQAISNKPIPILVNDVPITQFDISQRAKLMRLGGSKSSSQAAAQELIDETLQSLEAQRRDINVSGAQVDAAFEGVAARLKMSPAQLTAALRSEGIEAESLKKRLRAQIIWTRLVQFRTQTKAAVKATDITTALLEKGDPTSMTVTEYILQQIVFVVPAGSATNLYAQRRSEAEAFRQRFRGCESSLEQAKQLRGVVVKDIGRRSSAELGGPDGDEILKTTAGKTTRPLQTDQGVQLIAVCATKDIQSTSAARSEVENQLYLAQAEGLGADYLKELRARAIIEYR